ncbi:MAG: ABC transporter ATP-binding protein [Ilumatobacteraceae bacterium]
MSLDASSDAPAAPSEAAGGDGATARPADPEGAHRGTFRAAFVLLRQLLRRHKRVFATAVGGAAVFAACTVLSADIVGRVTDDVVRPRFDEGSVGTGTVVAVLGALILVGVVRGVGVVVRRTWAGITVWRIVEQLTGEVVDHVVTQPAPWHRRQSTGDLITRAGVDTEAATAVLQPLPFATSVVVMLVLSSIWLVVTDPVLGLAAVAVFPLLLTTNVVYQRRIDRYFAAAQTELGALSSAVHESFDGVHVVKAFGAERRETERLAVIAARLRAARRETVRLRSAFEALIDGVPNVVNVGLLIGGAYRVRDGEHSAWATWPDSSTCSPCSCSRCGSSATRSASCRIRRRGGIGCAACSTSRSNPTRQHRSAAAPTERWWCAASSSPTTASVMCSSAPTPTSPRAAPSRWSVPRVRARRRCCTRSPVSFP